MIFREVVRFSMPLFLRAVHELVTVDVQIGRKIMDFCRTLLLMSGKVSEMSEIESMDMN